MDHALARTLARRNLLPDDVGVPRCLRRLVERLTLHFNPDAVHLLVAFIEYPS